MTAMFSYDPSDRLSIPDILAHPWMENGQVITAEEVSQEMQTRSQRRYAR